MTPLVYTDLCLMGEGRLTMGEVAVGASVLMRSLHATFSQMPGCFALALPDLAHRSPQRRLSRFRVFASRMEDLAELHTLLKNGDGLGRLFNASFPETVPADFKGPWMAYRRLRIHSRERASSRAVTMRALDEAGNSWVDMGSSDNRQRFRMYLACEALAQGASPPPLEGAQVNSYGLSVAGYPLYLPHIP